MPTDSKILRTDEEYLSKRPSTLELAQPLRFLTPKEVCMIDNFLDNMDMEGELRLVVQKGRLRFVTKTKDIDILDSELEGEDFA
ncbi:MAG: hypothetical protein GTO18_09595 [Anaerolineales bacterium]|nr:hypothetical protein [Anaerolineales bacterium]